MTKEDIYTYIDEHKKEAVELLQEMIRFNSVYEKEEDIQRFLSKKYQKQGWDTDLWKPEISELESHEAYSEHRRDFNTSPLLVGTIKGVGGGKSLILNGHIDVVPEGDGWTYPPYGGTLADGKIIGRGANDMKGGLAGGIMALKFLSDLGIRLKGDVYIESVVDEEVGSAGALAVALRGYRADGAIIPEPSKYAIVPASQGSTFFRITIPGRTAHGAYHYLGVNAIEKAHYIMDKLKELELIREAEFKNELFRDYEIQCPIAVCKLHAGMWPSMVPDTAVMEGRYGVFCTETMKEARTYFEEFLEKAFQEDEWLRANPPQIEWLESWNSGMTEPEHELVATIQNVYTTLENKEPVIKGYAAPTDLAILTRYADTPTVVYGPGNDSLHAADEYIEVDDYIKYVKHFATIVMNWCGVEE